MSVDKQQIAEFTEFLIKELKLDFPYLPEKVVEILGGGKIIYDENENGIDGYIKKIDNKSFEIHLNEKFKGKTRERFTIAHELGHLFLHMGYLTDKEKWENIPYDNSIISFTDKSIYADSAFYRKDDNYSNEENEANEFAACFLMPEDKFRNIAKENYSNKTKTYKIEPIAEYFKVSLHATSNRGKWLGLFAW